MTGSADLAGVWDFAFFWNTVGYLLRSVAPFVMITVAILAVGLIIYVVIAAVRAGKA